MYGSGVGTGMQILIQRERWPTIPVRIPVPSASPGAALGTLKPFCAGLHVAKNPRRIGQAISWAFAW